MTEKEFAKFVGISQALWSQVLNGVRNLGDSNAQNVATTTRTKAIVWMSKKHVDERPKLWAKIKRMRLK